MAETNKHYDISAEFFQAFLDPYMKYTSGLYHQNETLEEGILNMLNKHVSFLQGSTNPAILEVGPGWGSFIKRLSEVKKDFTYTAINPSLVQNTYIQTQIQPDAIIHEGCFETADSLAPNSFDIIYFIGSFCHMTQKENQLEKLYSLLKPGGRVIIEDTFFITKDLFTKHAFRSETSFVQKEVFGFAEILALPEFLETVPQKGFQMVSLLEHSSSYARTIDFWLGKLADIQSPEKVQFIQYLKIAQKGWNRTIANYLIELRKMGPQ
ncbi:SAM-dependent methyltransferase [Bdellovibrio sp. HCB337]|uniref:SAM-dependent methyltransferase n=1 Tax=Bdellovibrio sp. HCB337 TaxID=3394358 RepID=UPI0039A66CB9